MIGWPITIWFRTEREAQEAARLLGYLIQYPPGVVEFESLQLALCKPSMALAVGHRFTNIPLKRSTPYDR